MSSFKKPPIYPIDISANPQNITPSTTLRNAAYPAFLHTVDTDLPRHPSYCMETSFVVDYLRYLGSDSGYPLAITAAKYIAGYSMKLFLPGLNPLIFSSTKATRKCSRRWTNWSARRSAWGGIPFGTRIPLGCRNGRTVMCQQLATMLCS